MKLLEYFNNSISNSRMTLITGILLYYMASASTNLSHKFNGLMEDNHLAQHGMGFLRLFVTLVLISGIKDMKLAIFYSLIAYIWFILAIRLDLEWNAAILMLLIIGFVFENKLVNLESKYKQDQNMSKEQRDQLYSKHMRYRSYTILIILGLTTIGTIAYMAKNNNPTP